MGIILQFYPNGEFVQGYKSANPHRREAKASKPHHEPLTPECRDAYLQWASQDAHAEMHLCIGGQRFVNKYDEVYTYLYKDSEGHHHYAWEGVDNVHPDVIIDESVGRMIAGGHWRTLGLSDSRILTKPENSRKTGAAMTKRMARNLRNSCYLLEQKYGKDNLSFLTLTLPNLSSEGLALCCANWDKMVHNFLKWLRHKVRRHGYDLEYCYCTEIQPSRYEQRGEYAPHLHLVFRGRFKRKSPWAITPIMARKEWVRQIKSLCDETFTATAVENLQRVKKSAAGYLSKYLSKGCNVLPQGSSSLVVTALHTHWGGMSRNLSRDIKRQLIRLEGFGGEGDIASTFLGQIPRLLARGLVKFWHQGFIPIRRPGSGDSTYGLWVGCGCLARPLSQGGLVDALILIGC